MHHWFCILLLLVATAAPSRAATREEVRAFDAAAKAFHDTGWARAEREFGEFLQQYPKSERRTQAMLFQAQARCKLGDFGGAIELIEAGQPTAGALADQFAYWLGEAQFQRTNYPAAAAAFRAVAQDFPESKLRLEASVSEAAVWAGLNDWARVETLLGDPEGAFQQLAQAAPRSEAFARGMLLLAEARLARGNAAGTEEAVRRLDGATLSPVLAWRREFLLCRALLGSGQPEPALASTSNLVTLARATTQASLQAQSVALQATALEELGRLENAAAVYALNLATDVPGDLQRQALLKIAELALVRGRLPEAAQLLASFMERHPDSPAADLALLTLGELQFKQHLTATPGTTTNVAPTNLLQQALGSFDALLGRFPQSALTGKAQLQRGWCFLLATNLAESAAAFAAAAELLPPSFDQAVARFKLADAQYQLNQFGGAISNYQAVVARCEDQPAIRTNLCEPALYQLVHVATTAGDLAAANEAAGKILAWFPDSHLTESSLLLTGQGLARHGNPAAARQMFENLLKRSPDSPRAAQIGLAIARTYELQRNWPAAAKSYEAWLTAFTADVERPRAEYALAWTSYRAGEVTNALARFTQFVAAHPTNALAPQAQWSVADYHFRRAEFVEAERNYQLLFQTWPASGLAYEARMMAGRAAFAREGWSDAIRYFTNLTSDLNCPADLKVQAIFGYGDALRRVGESAETNNPANLEQAIRVFRKVHELNPTNAAAARAWGEIGNCHFQLAAQDAQFYPEAVKAYQQVLELPGADIAARSQARVGLGAVAETLAGRQTGSDRVARQRQALDAYLDVFYEKDLRAGERADPFWLKRAGLDAVRVAETLQDWPLVIQLCERLRALPPPASPTLDKRIARAEEQLKTAPR
jgi:TolA-binding protein